MPNCCAGAEMGESAMSAVRWQDVGVALGRGLCGQRRRGGQRAAGDDLLDGPDKVCILVDADDDVVHQWPGQRRARGVPEDDRSVVEAGGGVKAPVGRRAE